MAPLGALFVAVFGDGKLLLYMSGVFVVESTVVFQVIGPG